MMLFEIAVIMKLTVSLAGKKQPLFTSSQVHEPPPPPPEEPPLPLPIPPMPAGSVLALFPPNMLERILLKIPEIPPTGARKLDVCLMGSYSVRKEEVSNFAKEKKIRKLVYVSKMHFK